MRNMIVSIIGRPNVGKSSIFNMFINQGKAITHDRPGITRDRHYGLANLDMLAQVDKARDFILVDTGGFLPQSEEKMNKYDHFFHLMKRHAEIAIDESDLVLFVVDINEGLTPFDTSIQREIKKRGKPFWLIVNKMDTSKDYDNFYDFYSLGIDENQILKVSAAHNRGIVTLKENLQNFIVDYESNQLKVELQKGITPREDVVSRVALIGAPNAGKSTLLNQLIGEKRALVSDIPGTTLDPIEGYFDLYFKKEINQLKAISIKKDNRLLFKEYEEFKKNNSHNVNVAQDDIELENDEKNDSTTETIDKILEQNDSEELEKAKNQLIKSVFNSQSEIEDEQILEEKVSILKSEENKNVSFWRTIHLIDTAGIRKKSQIQEEVEEKSVFRSLRAISESDIVIVVVDITLSLSHQDKRLIGIAMEKGKSVIVALNKVDLINNDSTKNKEEWALDILDKNPWLQSCSIIPISALKKKGLNHLKQTLKKTILVRHKIIPTSILNKTFEYLIDKNPVVVAKARGAKLKVKYASQLKSNPPTFLLFCNKSKGIPDQYKRYLKNSLRNQFELINTPIHLIFRTGAEIKNAQRLKST